MNPKRQAVIDQIRAAFADVKLCDGIGLWEAQGLDDYEDEWVCKQYREKDEKEDWSKIPAETLARCHSSLSFFDAQGMRFHLPAFLIGELNGTVRMSTDFHLTALDDFMQQKYTLLNEVQRSAVESFLWEILQDEDYSFSREEISQSLEDYWMKK